jgi:hypothetical protein
VTRERGALQSEQFQNAMLRLVVAAPDKDYGAWKVPLDWRGWIAGNLEGGSEGMLLHVLKPRPDLLEWVIGLWEHQVLLSEDPQVTRLWSALRPSPSALRPPPSALRHPPSALRPPPSALRPSPFVRWQQQHTLTRGPA